MAWARALTGCLASPEQPPWFVGLDGVSAERLLASIGSFIAVDCWRAMADDELNNLRRLYVAIQKREADQLRGSLTHDFELDSPEALPWGGVRHAPEGIETVLEIFLDHVEGSWGDAEDFLDAGDGIVVLGRARGRARTTGDEFEVPFAHVWGWPTAYRRCAVAISIPNRSWPRSANLRARPTNRTTLSW